MILKEHRRTIVLISAFLFLQLLGQISAGFAGEAVSIINPFTVISYFCLISRGVLWVLILKRVNLLAAYPFTGIIYLLILPISYLVFDESITRWQIWGAAMIFIGIMLNAAGNAAAVKKRS
jgi:drug/metabolite transporter (DMT)-like permease